MQRLALSLALLTVAASAFAQTQTPSPFYPVPPPEQAPKVDQGQPLSNLSSPLDQDQQKVTRTVIDSEAEAQLFVGAVKVVWSAGVTKITVGGLIELGSTTSISLLAVAWPPAASQAVASTGMTGWKVPVVGTV